MATGWLSKYSTVAPQSAASRAGSLTGPGAQPIPETAPRSAGSFVVDVHRDWAPNGADRFYNLVKGGFYNGVRFAYLSTDEDLGFITEILDVPPGLEQEPDAVYP